MDARGAALLDICAATGASDSPNLPSKRAAPGLLLEGTEVTDVSGALDLLPLAQVGARMIDHARSVFVTGATGVVGSELVRQLLATGCTVHALVRGESAAASERRLHDVLGDEVVQASRGRLEVVRGDVRAPRLGLHVDVHDRLATRIDAIVHGAANLRLERPRTVAVFEDVFAMRSVLALAERAHRYGRLRKVELVSTVGVGGRSTPMLPERFLEGARAFHNTYEEAKAASEDRARAALERGLPITVHRPSMVVGHSRTGAVARPQVFYAIADFLAGVRTAGVLPTLGPRSLDLVPVDFVASALVASLTAGEATIGRVLHHASGPRLAVPLRELADAARRVYPTHGFALRPLRFVPARVLSTSASFLRRVLPEPEARRLAPVSPLLRYLATDQRFATTRTEAWRREVGLVLPAPSEYLTVVLEEHLRQRERNRHARQTRRVA